MNKGQKVFLDFILERIQDEKQDNIKELLKESYTNQKKGSFTVDYLESLIYRIVPMLKPEYVKNLKRFLMNMSRKVIGFYKMKGLISVNLFVCMKSRILDKLS